MHALTATTIAQIMPKQHTWGPQTAVKVQFGTIACLSASNSMLPGIQRDV